MDTISFLCTGWDWYSIGNNQSKSTLDGISNKILNHCYEKHSHRNGELFSLTTLKMYETPFHTTPPPDSPRQSEIIRGNMIPLAKKLPIFAACHAHFFCLDISEFYEGVDILSLFTNRYPQFSLRHLHQHPTPSFTAQLINWIQVWISSKLSGT